MVPLRRGLEPRNPIAPSPGLGRLRRDRVALCAGAPDGRRVRASGKLLRLGEDRWYVKGLTYGPFTPRASGHCLPERGQLLRDLAHVRRLGANAIRLYHLPSPEFLDDALDHGLRVLIDVPWDKHRCFLEDWASRHEALRTVAAVGRDLGEHPALLGVSVANEIPKDVVRFYGAAPVARFIDSLVDALKQQAPDCLATYTNYPSTEFLCPTRLDFYCANVYLEDSHLLGQYLDRLQHVAGALPLVLGEYGVDSLRATPARQAELLAEHVRRVFHHGLAGSFVFSYTDDWFTGGSRVEDWAFGITGADRAEKPAAAALSRVWSLAPRLEVTGGTAPAGHSSAPAGLAAAGRAATEPLPRVSVVVCSYNGAATLPDCLESLGRLDYPDYEVILVDDGSTDDTPDIAARFPNFKTIRQANAGLSAARNVGWRAATGQVVAYTDADCVADETWLIYLVRALREQGVDGIGGPNVPPSSDGWVARCVAASPGGPSHVMLDDRRAEHVPGCNMAFWRDRLEAVGGFDPQFRVAGDDVDICWRFLDAGLTIGYAPSALVWHHRRSTVAAYCRQQEGYGRSEAMLHYKYPRRFNSLGCSRWNGIIYGNGGGRALLTSSTVYHGRFGSGLFQIVYRRNEPDPWAWFTLLEWHALALLMLTLSPAFRLAGVAALGMWALSLVAAKRQADRAELPAGAPRWCRSLVAALHLIQPPVRAWHRYAYRFRRRRIPRPAELHALAGLSRAGAPSIKQISLSEFDLYWESRANRGREDLLDALVDLAPRAGWPGDFHAEWELHDVELCGTAWHDVRLRTATEELGRRRRFTRVRCALRPTVATYVLCGALAAWTVGAASWVLERGALGAAAAAGHSQRLTTALPLAAVGVLWVLLAAAVARSRASCRASVSALVSCAATAAQLEPVAAAAPPPAPQQQGGLLDDDECDELATVRVA